MRKDLVQPRKRKQPAQGRRRKRKGGRGGRGEKGKERLARCQEVLGTLLHTYSKVSASPRPHSALTLPGCHPSHAPHPSHLPRDKENGETARKTRSQPAPEYETYQVTQPVVPPSQLKTLELLAEQEKYRWPPGGFDLSQVKTEDSEVGQRCVAPLEVSRGIRDYSCSFSECRHLHFTALDGPHSVREHMKLHH